MFSKFEKAYMRIISEMNMVDPVDTNKSAGMNIEIDGLVDNDYYSDGYRECTDYSYMDKFYDESEVYDAHDKLFSYKGIILDANFDEPDYMKINVTASVDGSSINVLAYTDWEKVVDNSKNREILFKVTDFVNQYKFIKIDGIHAVEVDGEEIDVDAFAEQYPELNNQIMNFNPTQGKNVVFGWDLDSNYLTFRTV